MTFLLDSNVCVQWLRKKGHPLAKARVAATPVSDIRLCSVVLGELLHGAEESANPAKNRAEVLAFTGLYQSLLYGDAEADEYVRTWGPSACSSGTTICSLPRSPSPTT